MVPSSVIGMLASSLGRRDEGPNVELAKHIVKMEDKSAIKELVENLSDNRSEVQADCIKVLYEIGDMKPVLISGFVKQFLALLGSKKNRLVWGAMTALDSITLEEPAAIIDSLPRITEIANSGSVITRDHAVSILTKLASTKKYEAKAVPLLAEQLENCPGNQLPMYAEGLPPIANDGNRGIFMKTLGSRVGGIERESKRKRVEKVMKLISQRNS
jgi:non-SMC mitotic condensation complex subunit 1